MADKIIPGEVRDFTIPDGQGGAIPLHGIVQAVDTDTITMQSTTSPVALTVPVDAVGEVSGLGWFAVAAQVEAERAG